jgi:hypothetical protein
MNQKENLWNLGLMLSGFLLIFFPLLQCKGAIGLLALLNKAQLSNINEQNV